MLKSKVLIGTAWAAAMLCGSVAHAQQAGDIVLGAGWMYFSPQDSSKPLTRTVGGVSTQIPNSLSLIHI